MNTLETGFLSLISGVFRVNVMPTKSTRGDLLARDTTLLQFLSKHGVQLNISRIVDELGYPDDSSVNKRIHQLEERGLVQPSKKGLG
jgi:predicted transcriptional regulator